MQPKDEGYIKFNIDWIQTDPYELFLGQKYLQILDDLIDYRQKLYGRNWIGTYPDGIGFGNISRRFEGNTFIISGSATGKASVVTQDHFSKVFAFDILKNKVVCKGAVKASSESLSHAIIYQTLADVNVVLHIHDEKLWLKSLNKYPTTHVNVPYGTPRMANEIERLLLEKDWNNQPHIIIMAGHEEGIIAFGNNMEEAFVHLDNI